jgi:Phasin protein
MAHANESPRQSTNAFAWAMPPFFGAPLMSLLADFNGKLLESVAGAQKEWADFVTRRIREDVAVSQQLVGCQSLADLQDVYCNYLRKAVDQYQEQSQRALQKSQSAAEELADAAEPRARENAQRARH